MPPRQSKAVAQRQKAVRWLLVWLVSFAIGVWNEHGDVWWWLLHIVMVSTCLHHYVRWKLYFAQAETIRRQREAIQELEHAIRVRMEVMRQVAEADLSPEQAERAWEKVKGKVVENWWPDRADDTKDPN